MSKKVTECRICTAELKETPTLIKLVIRATVSSLTLGKQTSELHRQHRFQDTQPVKQLKDYLLAQ
jgi:hypothetical protein